MVIGVVGKHITELGHEILIPENATVINCQGKFAIPGLWDMHVHLGNASETSLELFIANGVTGVRDMGSNNLKMLQNWRSEISLDNRVGPRIITPGPILDGGTYSKIRVLVNTEMEARHAVDSLAKLGADFIKVHEHLNREAYLAIADEASKLNLSFAGHIPTSGEGYIISGKEASDLGQTSLEHMLGIPFPGDTIGRHALMSTLVNNGTYVTPTLSVYWVMAHREDSSVVHDPRMKYVAPMLREWWQEQMTEWSRQNKGFRQWLLKARMKMIPVLHSEGVMLLAGTDVGFVYIQPGSGLHDELAHLVEAGLSPMKAIMTATINPARYLNRANELGSIEKGKLADFVILNADPIKDIHNTTKISSVIVNGKLFSRKALDELLIKIEKKSR